MTAQASSLPHPSSRSPGQGRSPQNAPWAVMTDEEWCPWGGRKIPLSLRCNKRSEARYHWENYSPRCLPWHRQRTDLQGASENERRREQVEGRSAAADRWWGSNESGWRGWQGQEEVGRQAEVMGYKKCVCVSWCFEIPLCAWAQLGG